MIDIADDYQATIRKLREALHDEMSRVTDVYSRAMEAYSDGMNAALADFADKVADADREAEIRFGARFQQFRGEAPAAEVVQLSSSLPKVSAFALVDINALEESIRGEDENESQRA